MNNIGNITYTQKLLYRCEDLFNNQEEVIRLLKEIGPTEEQLEIIHGIQSQLKIYNDKLEELENGLRS